MINRALFQKFISAKMMLTPMRPSRASQVPLNSTVIASEAKQSTRTKRLLRHALAFGFAFLAMTCSGKAEPLTVALTHSCAAENKFYETANAQKIQLLDAITLRGQATHYLLRFGRQSNPNGEEAGEKTSLTWSNFTAMNHTPDYLDLSWFTKRIGESVMFYSQGWYVLSEIVSEDDAYSKWLTQRTEDIQWFEAPDEMIDQLKALQP